MALVLFADILIGFINSLLNWNQQVWRENDYGKQSANRR